MEERVEEVLKGKRQNGVVEIKDRWSFLSDAPNLQGKALDVYTETCLIPSSGSLIRPEATLRGRVNGKNR